MEAMEVDFHQEGPSRRPEVNAAAAVAAVAGQAEALSPVIILESGSSTELEDDDEDGEPAPHHFPRLPTAWAFSQRAEVGVRAVARTLASQGAIRRRRVRYKLMKSI